jgi:hypothetical protein
MMLKPSSLALGLRGPVLLTGRLLSSRRAPGCGCGLGGSGSAGLCEQCIGMRLTAGYDATSMCGRSAGVPDASEWRPGVGSQRRHG